MTIHVLTSAPVFPPIEDTDETGILAMGGDLSPKRLIAAYSHGVFPWPHRGLPLTWFAPDPRMVLFAREFKMPRSLRQTLRKGTYEIRLDTAFPEVMAGCATARGRDEDGTWISKGMIAAYTRLHKMGLAHSAEAWCAGKLTGGLYGVCIGGVFFGESMFTLAPDASKAAFATLVDLLIGWGIELIDCQTYSDHLARFGAKLIPRSDFQALLAQAIKQPGKPGLWRDSRPATNQS